MYRRALCVVLVAILLLQFYAVFAQPLKVEERDKLIIFDNGVIHVAIPSRSAFPRYYFWYRGR